MTKPREKTREELQAEIEDGKKKIRQFENRENPGPVSYHEGIWCQAYCLYRHIQGRNAVRP